MGCIIRNLTNICHVFDLDGSMTCMYTGCLSHFIMCQTSRIVSVQSVADDNLISHAKLIMDEHGPPGFQITQVGSILVTQINVPDLFVSQRLKIILKKNSANNSFWPWILNFVPTASCIALEGARHVPTRAIAETENPKLPQNLLGHEACPRATGNCRMSPVWDGPPRVQTTLEVENPESLRLRKLRTQSPLIRGSPVLYFRIILAVPTTEIGDQVCCAISSFIRILQTRVFVPTKNQPGQRCDYSDEEYRQPANISA